MVERRELDATRVDYRAVSGLLRAPGDPQRREGASQAG